MDRASQKVSIDWLALWGLFSAWSSLAGWVLSVFGQLNAAGVAISCAFFLGCLFLLRSQLMRKTSWRVSRLLRSRFWAPRLWLALTCLALVGGLFYSPNNYDYMSYRFTRVLYWTSENGWFWVPTIDHRVNYSGTAFEWLMTPLFLIFKTDRLFFLINFVSYLFLPGLVFSVFSGLGISRRISWWWMWVLPCGYCYILQAASAGNDAFAAIYFLASLHYLLQPNPPSPTRNLFLSCLAIALMTSAKASNLPLLLPWLIVLLFRYKDCVRLVRAPVLAVMMVPVIIVSFLPMALINIHFTGDYSGDPTNKTLMKVGNPLMGVAGNSLQMAKDNLMPPIWPRPINWATLLPSSLIEGVLHGFPRLDLRSGELQIEEQAGLGLGIVLCVGAFVFVRLGAGGMNRALVVPRKLLLVSVTGAGAIAWMVYMSKMGSEATSRLIAAYYPLLVAGILALCSLDGRIMRRRIISWVGMVAMLSAFPLVILSPARPLFPASTVSSLLEQSHVPKGIIDRYNQVYSVYAQRPDVFKELMVLIPPGEKTVGLLQAGDDDVAALWRPFGSRRMAEVQPSDSRDMIKSRGIHYVVINQDSLQVRYHTTLPQLLAQWTGSLVAEKKFTQLVRVGPQTWYLIAM